MKKNIVCLKYLGLNFDKCDFDSMIASYILNYNEKDDISVIANIFDYDVMDYASIIKSKDINVVAKEGVKKLVGPSEMEIANKKEARNTAKAAVESPEKAQELLAAYENMINQRDQLVQEGIDETAVQDTTQPQYQQEYVQENQFDRAA